MQHGRKEINSVEKFMKLDGVNHLCYSGLNHGIPPIDIHMVLHIHAFIKVNQHQQELVLLNHLP